MEKGSAKMTIEILFSFYQFPVNESFKEGAYPLVRLARSSKWFLLG